MKNKKADICTEIVDGVCYVYVLDKRGKRCFCRKKTQQTISIANAIYISEYYGDLYEEIQRRKSNAGEVNEG